MTTTEKEEEEQDASGTEFDYIAYEKDHTVKETDARQRKASQAFGMRVEDLFGGEDEANKKPTASKKPKNSMISSLFSASLCKPTLCIKETAIM